MAEGEPLAAGDRGGERIPSLRASLIVASLALVGGAGAIATAGAEHYGETVELLTVLGLVLLLPALVLRRAGFIGLALALVGAGYAVSVSGRGNWRISSWWRSRRCCSSAGARLPGSREPALGARRAAARRPPARRGDGVGSLAAAVAAFLLASSGWPRRPGIARYPRAWRPATGALALVARLARRGARLT